MLAVEQLTLQTVVMVMFNQGYSRVKKKRNCEMTTDSIRTQWRSLNSLKALDLEWLHKPVEWIWFMLNSVSRVVIYRFGHWRGSRCLYHPFLPPRDWKLFDKFTPCRNLCPVTATKLEDFVSLATSLIEDPLHTYIQSPPGERWE